MTCGLSSSALDILNYLVWKKAVSEKHSRAIMAIERDAPDGLDVSEALKELENLGLVGRKKKDRTNYWAVLGPAQRTLQNHGYRIIRGGRISL